jgi:hydrogenase expression/formation protein HypC
VCLAIPGCVVEVVDEHNRLAKVDFAISKIDEAEAHATRALLEGMGAEYEQELAELRESVIE